MDVPTFHDIFIVGAGVCGRQIAIQFARHGFGVTLFDAGEEASRLCIPNIEETLRGLVGEGVVTSAEAADSLRQVSVARAPEAAAAADLLIESAPENLTVKRNVLRQFHAICPPRTIFVTNASYLFPSSLAAASGRPERFAAFHFHVPVWHANVVDIMPHPRTDPAVTEALRRLAVSIGQTPVCVKRENPGYIFNAMLQPLLMSALDLVARGVADVEDVDRAWMAITKMPIGPYGIIDEIGLDSLHEMLQTGGRWGMGSQAKKAAELVKGYIAQQRLGRKSNQGFYSYPEPAFTRPGFLTGPPPDDASATDETEGAAPDVVARFVPRVVPLKPAIGARDSTFCGGAIVVGEGSDAEALAARLRAENIVAVRPPDDLASDDAQAWMDDLWQAAAFPHLFLVGGAHEMRETGNPGPDAAAAAWYESAARRPFAIAQAWFRHLDNPRFQGRASLVAVTRLGGELGFDGHVDQPEGGGLAGLVKGIAVESMVRARPGVVARVVDFARGVAPREAATRVLDELADARRAIVDGSIDECLRRSVAIEVGYSDEKRRGVRYRAAAAHTRQNQPLPPRGSWIVTGGGSGITLASALALGKQFRLKLHVLGRTPRPDVDYLSWSPEALEALRRDVMRSAYRSHAKPNDAWRPYARGIELQRALRQYHDAGVLMEYHQCDVSDAERIAELFAELAQRGEALNGVLHGAGVERSTRLETKTLEHIDTVLKPKTVGTKALIDAAVGHPLEWFVAFGSLSGRFGSSGQCDYGQANEMMAKMVTTLRRRRNCHGVTIHWPGWQDVGMAAQTENRYLLMRAEHQLLPPAEGVRHLLEEIKMGAPDAEVIFVSPGELQRKRVVETPAAAETPIPNSETRYEPVLA